MGAGRLSCDDGLIAQMDQLEERGGASVRPSVPVRSGPVRSRPPSRSGPVRPSGPVRRPVRSRPPSGPWGGVGARSSSGELFTATVWGPVQSRTNGPSPDGSGDITKDEFEGALARSPEIIAKFVICLV